MARCTLAEATQQKQTSYTLLSLSLSDFPSVLLSTASTPPPSPLRKCPPPSVAPVDGFWAESSPASVEHSLEIRHAESTCVRLSHRRQTSVPKTSQSGLDL